MKIDLNCDMGEGLDTDAAIMPFISSANISCGFHAGDATTMRDTIRLAKKFRIAIGAHPSFEDREHFGRTEMKLPPEEIYRLVQTQLQAIKDIATEENALLDHVKPHGALYNMSARDATIASAIANAVFEFDPTLILFGLSQSVSITEAKKRGLKTASEVFADRTYQDDGSLTPRSEPNALIEETSQALRQVLQFVREQQVTTVSGKTIAIIADTICIHGDGSHAVPFARAIHQTLQDEHIEIKPVT